MCHPAAVIRFSLLLHLDCAPTRLLLVIALPSLRLASARCSLIESAREQAVQRCATNPSASLRVVTAACRCLSWQSSDAVAAGRMDAGLGPLQCSAVQCRHRQTAVRRPLFPLPPAATHLASLAASSLTTKDAVKGPVSFICFVDEHSVNSTSDWPPATRTHARERAPLCDSILHTNHVHDRDSLTLAKRPQ